MKAETTRPDDASITPAAATALCALHRALADHGQPAPDALGLPRGTLAVRRSIFADVYASFLAGFGPEATREQAMDRARRHGKLLVQKRVIDRNREWIWLTGRSARVQ